MDIIIKTIIFAICFPVGMSLIGGLRKKLKGSRSVSDSNFVKVAKKIMYSLEVSIFYYSRSVL